VSFTSTVLLRPAETSELVNGLVAAIGSLWPGFYSSKLTYLKWFHEQVNHS
jgi:hypothetical protein